MEDVDYCIENRFSDPLKTVKIKQSLRIGWLLHLISFNSFHFHHRHNVSQQVGTLLKFNFKPTFYIEKKSFKRAFILSH